MHIYLQLQVNVKICCLYYVAQPPALPHQDSVYTCVSLTGRVMMGPTEAAASAEGGPSCSLTGSLCRPRPRRLLLLVVAVLVLGQLSLNMLFYRNSDSLFYVNTTAPASGPLLVDSRVSDRVLT